MSYGFSKFRKTESLVFSARQVDRYDCTMEIAPIIPHVGVVYSYGITNIGQLPVYSSRILKETLTFPSQTG